MKIFVKAKPKNKKKYVKKGEGANFVVAVCEIPQKGKANQAIVESLAKFLGIPASSIDFVSGQTSKQKVFEVPICEEDLSKIPQDEKGQIRLL